MAILSRPRFLPQQRLDLEDVNALLSALRTDSKLYTKQLVANTNLIYKGFSVTGVGLKLATVNMADATLIIPQNSNDFSWFTSAPAEPNITIPDADLTDGVRNYVEISLATQNNTPLTKAFWDPEANSGLGQEFNQITNTITDLKVTMVVSTGGFSGSVDRLPLCIIDVDGSGNIKTILDRRNLFGRLATPANIDNRYSWGTKVEPTYALALNGVSGTFVAGETITIGTETALVTTGGTSAIAFNVPSGINFFPGDTVTGGTSGATGTINTVAESFSGVDKNLKTQKDINDALMTEFALVKGTRFWWQNAGVSLSGIIQFLESVLVQASSTGKFAWDGSELSITDDDVSPTDSAMGYIRIMGRGDDLALTREDGQAGTSPIAIADREVLYVKIPTTGDSTYSSVGATSSNYQVTDIASYESSDENYWLAYREGARLYIRGYGELEPGEEVNIGDPELEDILAAIAANLASANQDRTAKMVEGGTWTLNPAGTSLTLSANAYIQIPGLLQNRNTILAQTISLPNPISVAYVSINRSGSGALNLTVNVADEDDIVLGNNHVVIARRVSGGVLVGSHSFLLKAGESLELDGALAEINRYTQQLKIKAHATNPAKATINPANTTLLNGAILSQILGSTMLDFGGAVINFDTGDVLAADDTTALGTNFTPFSVPVGEYFWYGISLLPSAITADNQQQAVVQIDPASASDATAADAPKPSITGTIKLGAIQVYNNGGDIEVYEVRPLGVGSGSGSGDAEDGAAQEPLPGFKALTIDDFTVDADDEDSQVQDDKTNAEYDGLKKLYALACDKSKTVATSSGTGLTISGAPTFTVVAGDIVYATSGARLGQFRRIATVTNQTTYVLDSAFTGGNMTAADTLMVSQAVWTKDLVNVGDATEKTRPRDFFSGNITTIGLTYEDSLVADDAVSDLTETARIAVRASNEGLVSATDHPLASTFSSIFKRPAYPNQINYYDLDVDNTNKARLFLVFFPNPDNASVTAVANLLKYEASFYGEDTIENGGSLASAYCFTDGSGTEINCSAPTVVSSKTRIALNWSYVAGVNAGQTKGQLEVIVDGLSLPRYVSGTTTDGYYKEIADTNGVYNIIELDADYSLDNISVEIKKNVGVVDTSSTNSSRITTLENTKVALLNTLYFTASGTYTKNPLAKYVKVTVASGGGGSGGIAATSASQAAASGGGGGGGTSFKIIQNTSIAATEAVTVGAGGSAGAAGNNSGGNGGTSSFGSHCSATGGEGGGGALASTGSTVGTSGIGGVGVSGDLNINGSDGMNGRGSGGVVMVFANGGSSYLGGGARGGTGGTGTPGRTYGGGAGGVAAVNQAATVGAVGAQGVVIVEEYG